MTRRTAISGNTRMRLVRAAAVVAVPAVGGVACGDDSADDATTLGADAVIEYRYGDSSVPPDVHRSYTLTVDRDEVHVVVDSYGDVIGETTAPLPAEVWDDLVDNVGDVADVRPDGRDSDGCTGGTSRRLVVTEGGESVVDVDLYLCRDRDGERTNVEEAEQLEAYVGPVIAAVPGWGDLFVSRLREPEGVRRLD